MIKKIFITFYIFTLYTSVAKAQEGREWIVAGQPYWKIPVAEEAVYQIPYSQLNVAGISTASSNKIQLWFRGVEQSIYLDGTNLYFYGKANDGALDTLLYEPYSNRYSKYSLFSDTTYCFITIGSADGKRLGANAAGAAILQSSHRHTETIFFADEYYEGTLYSSDTHLSPGDQGEGWFSSSITQSGSTPVTKVFDIPVSNVFSGGADPELEIVLVGTNQNLHNIDIVINNSSVYPVPSFSQRQVVRFKQTIPLTDLTNLGSNQPLKVGVKLRGGTQQDYIAVSYITLRYPQTTNLTGKTFYTIEPLVDNTAKTFDFTDASSNAFIWDVSSEGAFVNLGYTMAGTTATTNTSSNTFKIIYASSFKSIIGIKSADMQPYAVGQGKMLLITSTKLLGSNTAVTDYAAYKATAAGGGISVVVTDVNKLYNLYTYGEKHALAIKRYCKEEINVGAAKYLFLVGKGINYNYAGTTNVGDFYYRKNPEAFINNTHTYQELDYRMEDLLPPYGWPASDMYYTITDITLRPKLATGRLSAREDADMRQYLNKVKANDKLTSDVIWRKHAVHLSGGKTSVEVVNFRAIVDGFKNIFEGPRFGGHVVRTYTKNLDAGAVDTKLIYSVSDEVNKGVSYITFFGHSSPSIIDLDIGNVSNPVYGYNNLNKYPLLIMNGCQSAEFFIQGSIPEDWIMTPDKGALLTLGHGDIGYPAYMQTYTQYLYKLNFTDNRFLKASIGDIQKKTIDSFLTHYAVDSNREIVNAQATQFVLQGDPSINLYKPQLPDYAIAGYGSGEAGEKKVFVKAYNSDPITAMSDSFMIGIPITNYGLNSTKPIQFKVRQSVVYNNTTTFDKTFPIVTVGPIGYVDTIYFKIFAKNAKFLGINKFEIMVDPGDSITEFNENNNVATLEYFLPLSSVSCLYPSEYSVVHDQPVNFVAQSIDLFQDTKTYHIEIDTSHLYNSPSKIVRVISSGALVKFTETLLTNNSTDSLVYYWRVRFEDLVANEDTLWGESSFIYIKDSPDGWSQSEYPQFFKDKYNRINISPKGKLSFNTNKVKLYARTQGNNNTNIEIGYNNNTLLAFILGGYNCNYSDGCLIVVFNGESTLPYLADQTYRCGVYENPQVQRFYDMTNPTTQNQVETFLKSIKKDDFVLFVSTGTTGANTWSATLKDVFINQLGAQNISNLGLQTPYILLSRNRPGATPLKEVYSTNPSDVIVLDNVDYFLTGTYKSGSITSTLIGPSTLWGTMYKTVKKTNNDFAELKVIRINALGKEIDTVGVPLAGDVDLNPLVPASSFPYIRLLMNTADTVDLTPAYLKKWQVIYAPVPEGTLDLYRVGIENYPKPITYSIGTVFNIPFAFENISNKDFPTPLKVVFFLKNEYGKIKRDTLTIGLLPKGQVSLFSYVINTADFPGKNTFQAYVNPKFQPELNYENNFILINYNILVDKIHPVIGAMFDGVHIFDGDVVSPTPNISITLADNNNLLSMTDSTMTVQVIDPNGKLIAIPSSTNADFIVTYWGQDPADKGKFRVEFKPKVEWQNGKYKLVVQGKDASGNRSSNQNLVINFEVVNESTITNFYPYPNPFSTSCRFVFSLTGKEIPEDIKIQIITVSGKVVREIFKADLGNIHIGDNITDYAWDGRDEFGDKLANGVYIYRVVIKNQNDKFDHKETSGDKAFKKGYGKLYILR